MPVPPVLMLRKCPKIWLWHTNNRLVNTWIRPKTCTLKPQICDSRRRCYTTKPQYSLMSRMIQHPNPKTVPIFRYRPVKPVKPVLHRQKPLKPTAKAQKWPVKKTVRPVLTVRRLHWSVKPTAKNQKPNLKKAVRPVMTVPVNQRPPLWTVPAVQRVPRHPVKTVKPVPMTVLTVPLKHWRANRTASPAKMNQRRARSPQVKVS